MLADSGVLDGEGDLDELAGADEPAGDDRRAPRRPAGRRTSALAQHASVVGMTFWSGAVAELHGDGGERRPEPRVARAPRLRPTRATRLEPRRRARVGVQARPDPRRRVRPRAEGPAREPARPLRRLGRSRCRGVERRAQSRSSRTTSSRRASTRGVGRSEAPPPIERAVEALMRRAEKAERREGIREAERYYARALELAERGGASRYALRASLQARADAGRARRPQAPDEELRRSPMRPRPPNCLDLRCAALLTLANIDSKQGLAADERATAGRGGRARAAGRRPAARDPARLRAGRTCAPGSTARLTQRWTTSGRALARARPTATGRC